MADRSASTVAGMALTLSTLLFSILVVKVQPMLTDLDPLLQLLIAAVSLGTLVSFLGWLFEWVRTRDVRGQWVYRSSSTNWGLAEISQTGTNLAYEVQLFATRAGVEAALAGDPVPAEELLGHTTSTFCEFEDGRVAIRYVVARSSTNYEKRAGFLELVPTGVGSEYMTGYWTSTLVGGHGELHLTRPQNLARLADATVAPGEEAPPAAGRAHVVGIGLIGGSFALALRGAGWTVTADDADDAALELAAAAGIATDHSPDGVDLLVLAAPTPVTLDLIASGRLPKASLVVDVASVKGPIVRAARAAGLENFVALHPMAGTEGSGFDDARADMLVGAVWALCPDATADLALVDRTIRLLHEVVSARVCVCGAEVHDAAVAEVSHLPHALALTLLARPGRGAHEGLALALAAGSFRDGTRVARGNGERIADMLVDNHDALSATLAPAIADLAALQAPLEAGDEATIRGWVDAAQDDAGYSGGGERRVNRVRTQRDLDLLRRAGEDGWMAVDATGQHLRLTR